MTTLFAIERRQDVAVYTTPNMRPAAGVGLWVTCTDVVPQARRMLGSPPPSLLSKDVVSTENSRTLHDRNMRSDDFPVDLFSLQLDELKLLQDKAPEAKSQVLVARYLTGMFTPFSSRFFWLKQ